MKRREFVRALVTATAAAATVVISSVALARIGHPLSPGSIAGIEKPGRRPHIFGDIPRGISVTECKSQARVLL